jgi:ABC-type spermidine/putrescine transport system permease subunit II
MSLKKRILAVILLLPFSFIAMHVSLFAGKYLGEYLSMEYTKEIQQSSESEIMAAICIAVLFIVAVLVFFTRKQPEKTTKE